MTLGEKLKKSRNDKGLTQIEAAKKLGVTNGALSGYERNYRDPDIKMLKQMADLYEVSIDYLVSNNMTSNNEIGISRKDEHDIGKRMAKIKKELIEGKSNNGGVVLSFMGEPMSEEAIESLLEALKHAERLAVLVNKKIGSD
ncbi:helix-turn-helix transcriptional regulator [Lysinibacillus mangiferihumi]|uniref:Helix-turn-helix transcriptional regulator n=1 Tax=Lysinibacillus mangiferihumi TaxID=1130819 RepID=A0A4U2YP91_9BACI|nr:helix-turn-helix transcriptional regulator [Lysinibacillus mangiferihumi]TKI63196.1 helix-turn-helix transcriptional regulator [Lysinibacillus mangiferihumi]